jgi:uncharacterized protein YcfJ
MLGVAIMKTSALTLRTPRLLCALACLAASGIGSPVWAQDEWARVISRVPVIQQVAVPQQVCQVEQVVTERRSGAGAALGAIAGGAMGNAIGDGGGRAAATILGLVGGAIVGNRIEGGGQPQVEHVQRCGTQTRLEQRTVAYQVTYEYGGRQYTVQMPNDPGPQLRVRVSPVVGSSGVISSPSGGVYGSTEAPPLAASENSPVLVGPPAVAVPSQAPVIIQQSAPPVYVAPPTVVTVQREYVPMFTPGPPVIAFAPSYAPLYRPHWHAPPSFALNVDVHRRPHPHYNPHLYGGRPQPWKGQGPGWR